MRECVECKYLKSGQDTMSLTHLGVTAGLSGLDMMSWADKKFWLATASSNWSFIRFMLTLSMAMASCLDLISSSLSLVAGPLTASLISLKVSFHGSWPQKYFEKLRK